MKIFVSSTFSDLIEHRQAAKDAILRAGHEPVLFEEANFPVAFGKSVQEIILSSLNRCDVLVNIIGFRTGAIVPGTNVPWTVYEGQAASASGKPIFTYVMEIGPRRSTGYTHRIHQKHG